MFFWKIDDETIRCLIHKQEIDSMGFDLQTIANDSGQMEEFLNAIVKSSQNYIDWHTENGIQNYIAKSLPADQLLVTISCTFPDVAIDRDLDQIKKMTDALNSKITDDRIAEIYSLSGDEKQKAFEEMSRDLQAIYSGVDEEEEEHGESHQPEAALAGVQKVQTEKAGKKTLTQYQPKKITFGEFSKLTDFCSLLEKRMYLTSSLFKVEDEYILLVDFSECESDEQVVAFLLTAEEYGGKADELRYDEAYFMEHGTRMIEQNAIETLCTVLA